MARSIYLELEREMLEARGARLAGERRAQELGDIRAALARLRVELAVITLEHRVARKYRPDQPRVPRATPTAGGGRAATSRAKSMDRDVIGAGSLRGKRGPQAGCRAVQHGHPHRGVRYWPRAQVRL